MSLLLNVYISALRKKCASLHPEGTVRCTHRAPWPINRGHQLKQTKWCCCQSNYTKHLKTFRLISNEVPALLLILSWWYFIYLQMYSKKFFYVYFYEQMFLYIFLAKGDTSQFFFRNNRLNSKIFINKPPSYAWLYLYFPNNLKA